MDSCKLGLHQWVYAYENTIRFCKKCKKKQEQGAAGKWIESRLLKNSKDETKYCECPQDYTISIKSMLCPRCNLPRRPRVLPTGRGDFSQPR